MKVLLGHPSGNQFFRHLAAGLSEEQVLGAVASCLNLATIPPGFTSLLPLRVRREIERRAFREPWAHGLRTRPVKEAIRLAASHLGWERLIAHETGPFCVDAVYRDFDRGIARQLPHLKAEFSLDAVYAYEDGALETFERGRELGLRCAYELPIAYWETGRRLMQEEAERLPAWRETLGGGISDSPGKLARKTRELELADMVVCPSRFVADSLPAWARDKRIIVAPFGSPPAVSEGEQLPLENQGPMRVLFVGSMGQRKGLGDLFAAVRQLASRDIELVVMGAPQAEMDFYRSQGPFTFAPGRPHGEVLRLMRSCDVFCLPSIVEGRALVMQEAMSQSLPLIITPNTGGEDLIDEGKTGFLVPIRSPELIAERLQWCLEHRDRLAEMGRAACARAARYTWGDFGRKIAGGLRDQHAETKSLSDGESVKRMSRSAPPQ